MRTMNHIQSSSNPITSLHLLIAFIVGGLAYPLLEIAYRGYSHWTMAILGGFCFAALFYYQSAFEQLPFCRKALLGALTIIALELSVGVVVNLWLNWAIWDYTTLRYHYLGQISLRFSLIWYILCSVFFWIAGRIRSLTKKESLE